MKIFIGVPHSGAILTPCVKSLLNLDLSGFQQAKIYFEQGTLLHFQRNNLVRKALEEKADYLFFVDSDMGFPQNTVKKLFSHKKDVVSGIYFSKASPFLPVMYSQVDKKGYIPRIDYPKNELFEVDAVGAGCLLISTKIFKKIEEPYFFFSERKVLQGQSISEDMFFCEKVRKAGSKIHCDSSVKCSHHGYHAVVEQNFQQLRPRIKYSDKIEKLMK
jgi:GT2 family glycosyltransferase